MEDDWYGRRKKLDSMEHKCNEYAKTSYTISYDLDCKKFFVYRDNWYENVYIDYCPFCGSKLI